MYIPVFPLILDASVPAVSPAGDIAVVVDCWPVDDAMGDGRGSSKKLQYNNASFKLYPGAGSHPHLNESYPASVLGVSSATRPVTPVPPVAAVRLLA